jgi:dihydroxy-acid dehydratase
VKLARQAGMQVLKLLDRGITPSTIMSHGAILNAVKVTLAIGGSTNLVLHLGATASVLGYQLELDEWDGLSQGTPLICKVKPSDPTRTVVDLAEAGGVPAVMMSLQSVLDTEAMTVTGHSLAENPALAEIKRPDIIRPVHDPYEKDGGLAVLRGNLAPEGAIIKKSAVPPEMRLFEGEAMVFEREEDAIKGLLYGSVRAGQVVVVRYEGPKGGPGMRQLQFFMQVLRGMGRETDVAFVMDGRFSGTNRGLAVGHVCPEAIEGGPIALVRTGDRIGIDIARREVQLLLSPEELRSRSEAWKPPDAKAKGGLLGLYAATATSAARDGATMFPSR